MCVQTHTINVEANRELSHMVQRQSEAQCQQNQWGCGGLQCFNVLSNITGPRCLLHVKMKSMPPALPLLLHIGSRYRRVCVYACTRSCVKRCESVWERERERKMGTNQCWPLDHRASDEITLLLNIVLNGANCEVASRHTWLSIHAIAH